MNAIRTLSVRLAMLGGALVLTTAGIVSSVAIVGAGPAVAAGTITQIAPDRGSVSHGTPFRDQLQTSGNIGPVTFATDSATTWGTVSSTGAVSYPGTIASGTYVLFGTDSDTVGDTGQWQYVLTCCRPPITQTAPTTGTVTTIGAAAFTDRLRTTGNTGPVTFTRTGGTAGLNVSSGGKITTSGTLAAGSYTATGIVADAFGGAGFFSYTLTVKAVTITQTAPTTGTVTTTGSAAFTDHLNTTGNIGKRSFVKTGGGVGLTVSFGGKIATIDTLETEVGKSRQYLDRVERQQPQTAAGALDLGSAPGAGR